MGEKQPQPPANSAQAPPPSYTMAFVQPQQPQQPMYTSPPEMAGPYPPQPIQPQSQQPQVVYQQAPAPIIYQPPPPPTQVVVVGGPYGGQFGRFPVTCECPNCHKVISSTLQPNTGLFQWLLCGGMCIVGLWCCMCIPFCIDDLKDYNHTCPNCNILLGTCKKI